MKPIKDYLTRSSMKIMRKIIKMTTTSFPVFGIKLLYKINTGDKLKYKNPKTFNEKIQWLKINHTKNDLYTLCSDKFLVRDYIKNKGYQYILNEVYDVYAEPEMIDFDNLPEKYVLKLNHGCGYNIINDGSFEFDRREVVNKLKYWKNIKFGCFTAEMQYWNIEPLIICEKYLEDTRQELNDYKIFCFNGIPKYIQVDVNRYTDHCRNIYDTDWNLTDLKLSYPIFKEKINSPDNLTEMLEISSVLSREFPFVRVDLYNVNGKIIFGELSFTPFAGYKKFEPDFYSFIFGDLLELPNP